MTGQSQPTRVLTAAIAALMAVALTACAWPNHRRYHSARTVSYGSERPARGVVVRSGDTDTEPRKRELTPTGSQAATGDGVSSVVARANAAESELPPPGNADGPRDPFRPEVTVATESTAPADAPLPEPVATVPTPPAPPPDDVPDVDEPRPRRVLTMKHLIDLGAAGLSDATILSMIRASWIDIELTPQATADLHRAGLSDAVIEAIGEKVHAQGSSGTPDDAGTPGVHERFRDPGPDEGLFSEPVDADHSEPAASGADGS